MGRPRLRLDLVTEEWLNATVKGFPADSPPVRVGELPALGWNVAREDLPLPLLTLRRSALTHNLQLMAKLCRAAGVLLAPHGKTTMAPQLWQEQLDAGAWGLTAATGQQLQVYRQFGVPRVICANELVDEPSLRFVARELTRDRHFELYSWVDSPQSVEALVAASRRYRPARPWKVLVEVGANSGRSGVRDDEQLHDLIRALRAAGQAVRLEGIAAYEGLLVSRRPLPVEESERLDDLTGRVLDAQATCSEAGLLEENHLITAGGSVAVDEVLNRLAAHVNVPARFVLRSGCYLTHDHGLYAATSSLTGLRPALELWSYVLSTPEPGLAILGFGRRDAPHDAGLPVPVAVLGRGEAARRSVVGTVVTLNDQHAYLRHRTKLQVGERVVLGVSHPCSAFDKWRLIPVVDDEDTIVDCIRTFF
ncbi:MAG: alanine racemase [Mycobacteriales bacterium]